MNKKIVCNFCRNEAFLNIRGTNYCEDCLKEKRYNSCTQSNGYTAEKLKELKRLAKIGKAAEKAYSKGAFLIYDVVEDHNENIEQYNCDETIEELLQWLDPEESEKLI